MEAENAVYFNVPVDPVALNIPDYFRIIPEPMDLGTVKSNLQSGAYASPAALLADVRLIFANCRLYNPAGSFIVTAANGLEAVFDGEWAKVQSQLQTAGPATESDADQKAAAEAEAEAEAVGVVQPQPQSDASALEVVVVAAGSSSSSSASAEAPVSTASASALGGTALPSFFPKKVKLIAQQPEAPTPCAEVAAALAALEAAEREVERAQARVRSSDAATAATPTAEPVNVPFSLSEIGLSKCGFTFGELMMARKVPDDWPFLAVPSVADDAVVSAFYVC